MEGPGQDDPGSGRLNSIWVSPAARCDVLCRLVSTSSTADQAPDCLAVLQNYIVQSTTLLQAECLMTSTISLCCSVCTPVAPAG
jgi:hypothetical protein